jgi:hypothetical protein
MRFKLGTLVVLAVALVLTVSAQLVAQPPPAMAAAGGATYRTLTNNVQGLPDLLFDHPGHYGMDEDERGHLIGKKIAAGDFDVVALIEVFDDSMRDALLTEMSPSYGFIAKKLAGPAVATQDGGLMLGSVSRPSATRRQDGG